MAALETFPAAWPSTRRLLRDYAMTMVALPRHQAPAHPEWWHVALLIGPSDIFTEAMPLPGGGAIRLRMDLLHHRVLAEGSEGTLGSWSLEEGLSGAELAEGIAGLPGVRGTGWRPGDLPSDPSPGPYDPGAATSFWRTLVTATRALERDVGRFPGTAGPPHLWPNGFDLSLEWFGRRQTPDEHGVLHRARITFGLELGADDQYFYANPWPFDEQLREHRLPHGAIWHSEGWVGSMLPFVTVAGDPAGLRRLAEYTAAVFELASPGL